MNDLPSSPITISIRNNPRSMGLKLLVLCGLAFVMVIPALFVYGIVQDRMHRAQHVAKQVGALSGGQQTFLGPILLVPYVVPPDFSTPNTSSANRFYVIFPEQGDATVTTRTHELHRSLFRVPVYRADLQFKAHFNLAKPGSNLPVGATLDWSHAEIVVGVSDPRGAVEDGTLTVNGTTSTFVPSQNLDQIQVNPNDNSSTLTLLGVSAANLAQPSAAFSLVANLHFSGAQRIAVLAFGRTTHLSMDGDWPNPSFNGGFLPVKRSISAHGFTAQWTIPFIARGVRAEGPISSLSGLSNTALGTSFAELVDPYQSVDRALKYVVLFIGLVFLTYFVFEVTSGKRVHPAQYVLVGIAQIIFYLLLLSISEHIGFGLAFFISGAATVILLALNTHWIFRSRALGYRALGVFSLLYALIYLLLRLEDNALIVGAVASFVAVAVAMYVTRNIDWYAVTTPAAQPPAQGDPPVREQPSNAPPASH